MHATSSGVPTVADAHEMLITRARITQESALHVTYPLMLLAVICMHV